MYGLALQSGYMEQTRYTAATDFKAHVHVVPGLYLGRAWKGHGSNSFFFLGGGDWARNSLDVPLANPINNKPPNSIRNGWVSPRNFIKI